jgi:hypothetical protein
MFAKLAHPIRGSRKYHTGERPRMGWEGSMKGAPREISAPLTRKYTWIYLQPVPLGGFL